MMVLRTLLAFFVFLILTNNALSQTPAISQRVNLVINPSFEILNDTAQKVISAGSFPLDTALGWSNPTHALPKISTSKRNGAIYDEFGGTWAFAARTGSKVAGIHVYGYRRNPMPDSTREFRDYLQGTLSKPLTIGKKYYFAFWVHYHCEGANNIGIAFFPNKIKVDSLGLLPFKPATSQRYIAIYDEKMTWYLVRDSFVAQQPYQYFVIGNFFQNRETKIQSDKFHHHYAYIDDVLVMEAPNDLMVNTPKPNWAFNDSLLKIKTPIVAMKTPNLILPPKPEVGKTFILKNVFFKFDSDILENNSYPELDSLVLILRGYPNMHIFIKGHTSVEGKDAYNQTLSEKRAAAVVRYLNVKGINNTRLSYKGFGEKMPIYPNDNEDNRKRNRRVEFEVLSN